jgi:hypothetical protein
VAALFARIQVLLHISPGSLEIGSTAAVVECFELVDVGSRLFLLPPEAGSVLEKLLRWWVGSDVRLVIGKFIS